MKILQPFSRIAWLLLPLLLLAYACEDDDAEPDGPEWIQWKELFSGYAAGSNVAPLFRAHPMNYDSLYIVLHENTPNELDPDNKRYFIYLEMFGNGSQPTVITGLSYPAQGARLARREVTNHDSIVEFESDLQDSYINGSAVIIEGIYQKTSEQGVPVLKLEFVQHATGWPSPPNAEDGFGSTGAGGYSNNNIHTFMLLVPDENEDQQ